MVLFPIDLLGLSRGWDLFHNGTVTSFHWKIKVDLE